jgi:hypothetical protein
MTGGMVEQAAARNNALWCDKVCAARGGPGELHETRGLVCAAAAAFPGLALVAYDRGKECAAAHRIGFATLGPLRIWRRTPTTHNATL